MKSSCGVGLLGFVLCGRDLAFLWMLNVVSSGFLMKTW